MDFKKRLYLGITAKHGKGWNKKINEINKLKIQEITLFIEEIPIDKRAKLYQELLSSCIKYIPLVHIRDDTTKEEIDFFIKKYKTKYFTIHESNFKNLNPWKGDYKKLFLEMNYDNIVPKKVNINEIGGFCIDLSHFKASEEKFSKDFLYVMKREKIKKYFKCNHLNGYSYKYNKDIHNPKKLKDFDYLKTLPEFIFGDVIALEMYNTIKKQIEYKEYLINLLNKTFNN